MAQIENDEAGIVRLPARDAHARPALGRDGLVVDAHVQRVADDADEARPLGGVAVDVLDEPVRRVAVGEEVEGVEDALRVMVVLENVAGGAAGDN